MKITSLIIPALFLFVACNAGSISFQIDDNHKVVFLDSIDASVEIISDEINGFFENISMVDMQIQMNSDCADRATCLKMYKEFLSRDVESFTSEEIENLKVTYKMTMEKVIAANPNILPDEIQLIKTKTKHYGPSVYYTRENIIVIPANELVSNNSAAMEKVTYHELFHIISRYNPNLKDKVYELIGFKKIDKDLVIPNALSKIMLLNPDGIEMHHYIQLKDSVQNRSLDVVPIIVSNTKQYLEGKNAFFSYLQFSMYEMIENADGKYTLVCDDNGYSTFTLRNAEDFYAQIQDNTGYIIHPDEILADNFMMIFAFTEEEKDALSSGGQKLLVDFEAQLQVHNETK